MIKSGITVFLLLGLISSLLTSDITAVETTSGSNSKQDQELKLATVSLGDISQVIHMADYRKSYYEKVRNSYYHGKPPENEEAQLRKDVWKEMIENTMLWLAHQEQTLALVDMDAINQEIDKYDQQYAQNQQWQQLKDKLIPVMRQYLVRQQSRKVMQTYHEEAVSVSEQEIHSFYLKNPQLFTEPERVRASIILIKVDPSSSSEVWGQAMEQMKKIRADINSLDDFKQMAELYSTDVTADQQGDMGFLHQGQYGGVAKQVIDLLNVGDYSEPVRLLEGIALFTVTDRIGATHHTFEEVKTRAGQLALRDKRQSSWQAYLTKLHKDATVNSESALERLLGD